MIDAGPASPARAAGRVKIPEPTMLPTTSAVAIQRPIERFSLGWRTCPFGPDMRGPNLMVVPFCDSAGSRVRVRSRNGRSCSCAGRKARAWHAELEAPCWRRTRTTTSVGVSCTSATGESTVPGALRRKPFVERGFNSRTGAAPFLPCGAMAPPLFESDPDRPSPGADSASERARIPHP